MKDNLPLRQAKRPQLAHSSRSAGGPGCKDTSLIRTSRRNTDE